MNPTPHPVALDASMSDLDAPPPGGGVEVAAPGARRAHVLFAVTQRGRRWYRALVFAPTRRAATAAAYTQELEQHMADRRPGPPPPRNAFAAERDKNAERLLTRAYGAVWRDHFPALTAFDAHTLVTTTQRQLDDLAAKADPAL